MKQRRIRWFFWSGDSLLDRLKAGVQAAAMNYLLQTQRCWMILWNLHCTSWVQLLPSIIINTWLTHKWCGYLLPSCFWVMQGLIVFIELWMTHGDHYKHVVHSDTVLFSDVASRSQNDGVNQRGCLVPSKRFKTSGKMRLRQTCLECLENLNSF